MDAEGNISASVYLANTNSSVRVSSGFETQLSTAAVAAGLSGTAPVQPQGNIAYMVETYFQYPDIGFLGWSTTGGAYTCFIFN